MQTHFSLAQLADPDIAEADKILRACVHCGFCTATCPTYVLLGDELDSPRGRIYLIKDMLENDRPATEEVVKHIDRCLSCLACMTTCPSGVHYMHLVDHARAHIEETYRRPWRDRLVRALLAMLLPYRGRFRAALALGWLAGRADRDRLADAVALPCRRRSRNASSGRARLDRRVPAHRRDAAAVARRACRAVRPTRARRPSRRKARARARVALLLGCANEVLAPSINEAAIRLLTRHGIEVVRRGGRRLLRLRSSITWGASSRRSRRRAATSMPGRARSKAAGSTRSSSPRPAAAPP